MRATRMQCARMWRAVTSASASPVTRAMVTNVSVSGCVVNWVRANHCGYVVHAAVCHRMCLNGGRCIAPDLCACRHGYYGHRCEQGSSTPSLPNPITHTLWFECLDIDECLLGLAKCPANSECVNKPGWYQCKCQRGFRAVPDQADPTKFTCQGWLAECFIYYCCQMLIKYLPIRH